MLQAQWNLADKACHICLEGTRVASIQGPTASRIWITAAQMRRNDSKTGTREADYLQGVIDTLMIQGEDGRIVMTLADEAD